MRTNMGKVLGGLCGPICVSGMLMGVSPLTLADHHGVEINIHGVAGAEAAPVKLSTDNERQVLGDPGTSANMLEPASDDGNSGDLTADYTRLRRTSVACPSQGGHLILEGTVLFTNTNNENIRSVDIKLTDNTTTAQAELGITVPTQSTIICPIKMRVACGGDTIHVVELHAQGVSVSWAQSQIEVTYYRNEVGS